MDDDWQLPEIGGQRSEVGMFSKEVLTSDL